VDLERVHAKFLGQGQGLPVVDFGPLSIGRIGVGIDDAKLVQRKRLLPAFFLLPSQVERLVGVLPGLLWMSRQTANLAEPCDPSWSLPRTRAESYADRLLQQRAPSTGRPWSA
jgi:hypothetical protein